MDSPRMNDLDWIQRLQRAKMSQKYAFQAIHVLTPMRNKEGAAPVVLQTLHEYLRAPAHTEACFELCLRHLNRLEVPWPVEESVTVPTLLANRATQALKLPHRFVPTEAGDVLDLCENSLQAPSLSAVMDLPAIPMLHRSATSQPADGAVLGMCEHSLPAPPPSLACTVEHVDLTACPMLLGNLHADSPTSPLELSANWPQDSPAPAATLLPAPACPTESFAAYLSELPSCSSPVKHRNVTMLDSPMGHQNAASDATTPGATASSITRKARRRSLLKARKQQVVRRW